MCKLKIVNYLTILTINDKSDRQTFLFKENVPYKQIKICKNRIYYIYVYIRFRLTISHLIIRK